MKLGVLADSHDNVPMVEAAVRRFTELGVELVIHAGDFVAPFAVAPLEALSCPVVAVFGNNDGERVGLANRFAAGIGEVHPILAEVEAGGRRIAAMHYPEMADAIAPGGTFDLVIYGHTHVVEIRPGRSLVLNPGEAGGWLTGLATAAVVDLTSLDVEILELRP
ncbi:MAG: metallophosphoesterase [Holophagales bacterium]|nr:metallophosphoesterase [Holophagales bacterium]